jgi:4-hydroxy-4-methyl-2-oxoglutarate aldolase
MMRRVVLNQIVFYSLFLMLPYQFMTEDCLGQVQLTSEGQVIFLTQEWIGDRDSYGRPVVSDNLLERMEYVALEEAWGTIRSEGYHNKFEGEWEIMHPGEVMVGRALTASFLPASPELEERMHEKGRQEGLSGAMNQYPIYMLEKSDVYVADGFGKIRDGTLIGDNLGQAIYSNSGNGVVFYGSARDLGGLREIEGFNAWVKGWHPSFIQEMMLISINGATRIGEAVVLPGDVVLATEGGVLFIPPHLAEQVVLSSEVTRLTDTFRRQRIREGIYTLEQTYGREWSEEIDRDFYNWVEMNRTELHEQTGVGYQTLDAMIETRSRNWRGWLE